MHDDREAGCVDSSPLVLRLPHKTRFPLMLPSNLQSSVFSKDFSGDGKGELVALPSACSEERGHSIANA